MKTMNATILSQLINLTSQAGEIIMNLRANSANYSSKLTIPL
jgi:3'(2'), 5'-bisphosphate nucleotidase